jgi:hypothetical protein
MSHENHIDTRDPMDRFMLQIPDAKAVLTRTGTDFILRTLQEVWDQSAILRDLGFAYVGCVGTLDGKSEGLCAGHCELIARAVQAFDAEKQRAALNRSQRWLEDMAALEDKRTQV